MESTLQASQAGREKAGRRVRALNTPAWDQNLVSTQLTSGQQPANQDQK